MSKYYSTTMTIQVRYVNMPVAKVVSNYLPASIEGVIRAKGHKLLRYNLQPFNDTLEFDVSSFMLNNSDSIGIIVTSKVVELLSKQIRGDVKLLQIQPDTLFFNFSKSIWKRVPVKLNVSLEFAEQYRLVDKIVVSPDSVTVSGDVKSINKIKYIETEELAFNGLDKSVSTEVKLKGGKKISLSNKKVKVEFNVAKFTERSLDVPIIIRNAPKGVSLRLFPDKATIKFLLPLESYEKTNEEMFIVEVDASDVLKNKQSKLKIDLTNKPAWVENVSVLPLKVEYIIKK